MHEDPEPLMQQLLRVLVGEGTFCPGYQFWDDLSMNPLVGGLFERAMAWRILHSTTILPGPVAGGVGQGPR